MNPPSDSNEDVVRGVLPVLEEAILLLVHEKKDGLTSARSVPRCKTWRG